MRRGLVARHPDRAVAAITEIVGHSVVRYGTDIRLDVGAVSPEVAVHVHRRVGGIRIAIHVIAARTGIAAERTGVGTVVGCDVSAAAAPKAFGADPPGMGGKSGG